MNGDKILSIICMQMHFKILNEESFRREKFAENKLENNSILLRKTWKFSSKFE